MECALVGLTRDELIFDCRMRGVDALNQNLDRVPFQGPLDNEIPIIDRQIAELGQLRTPGEVDPNTYNNRLEHMLARCQAILDVAGEVLAEEVKNKIGLQLGLVRYAQAAVVIDAGGPEGEMPVEELPVRVEEAIIHRGYKMVMT